MKDEELRDMLRNRERAHLRLQAIQDITHDRLPDAMNTLSQLVINPDPPVVGRCQFCGCTDGRACGIVIDSDDGPALVRCSWIDDEQTICSNVNCVEKFRRLNPEFVQTSARVSSGLIVP